jgi:AcrR family transcriptional regulator
MLATGAAPIQPRLGSVTGSTGLPYAEPARGTRSSRDGSPRGARKTDRDALLDALPRVVAEHDWVGTSTARVAHEAGVPPHEFWDHYRSLEHCFIDVYDRMMGRVTRTAIRSVASRTLTLGPAAWEDQLDAIMTGVLAFYSVEPALAKTCLVEVLEVGPAARARRDAALGEFANYVEGLRLTHGQPMPALAAELIVLGTADLMYKRVAAGEGDALLDLLPDLRLLWRASVADAGASASAPTQDGAPA